MWPRRVRSCVAALLPRCLFSSCVLSFLCFLVVFHISVIVLVLSICSSRSFFFWFYCSSENFQIYASFFPFRDLCSHSAVSALLFGLWRHFCQPSPINDRLQGVTFCMLAPLYAAVLCASKNSPWVADNREHNSFNFASCPYQLIVIKHASQGK